MARIEIQVNLGERSYPIVVTSGELQRVGEFARTRSNGATALIVCDEHTERPLAATVSSSFSAAGFRSATCTMPAGEPTKSLQMADRLFEQLIDLAADRQTLVVAVGGGVIGDLAGFAAATYSRGIPFLQVPTSLLAQVDSSVGGKVGINYRKPNGPIFKNMIGAFHQPVGVFIDTETLRSLPADELRAGLAEVVKYGVIMDADFFTFLESNASPILALEPDAIRYVVARCCRLKADVVEADEREVTDRRAILNYGHTFAHAIEAVTGRYRHGEAVAIGMIAASRLAERLGRLPGDDTARQARLLEKFGLPVRTESLDAAALLDAMQHDKKTRDGKVRFVLPNRIGAVELVSAVDAADIRAIVMQMMGE